jgi:hypothetical protein|tara:strand:- start:912 stop:1121 length:210 start_codon:yes stop_codon:yes gene_type:complete
MQQPKTGRQLILERLSEAIKLATTADLQRAAMFLEGAREVRAGSKRQRAYSRQQQATSWKKNVDSSILW